MPLHKADRSPHFCLTLLRFCKQPLHLRLYLTEWCRVGLASLLLCQVVVFLCHARLEVWTLLTITRHMSSPPTRTTDDFSAISASTLLRLSSQLITGCVVQRHTSCISIARSMIFQAFFDYFLQFWIHIFCCASSLIPQCSSFRLSLSSVLPISKGSPVLHHPCRF